MDNIFENVKPPEPKKLSRSRFDINDSALAVVIFIALNIAFTFVISGVNFGTISGTIWYYLLQVAVEVVFILAAFIVARVRNLSFIEDTGMKNKVSWKMVGWCFLVSLVSIIFFGNLTNVFIAFIELLGYESIFDSNEVSTFGQYIGMFFSICVAAAFCEELLFRGVILSGFRKYGAKVAIFASAFIFMIMHGNAEQTVHQFIVGLIVGVIFYKTGNLWIGVLVHFFNNLIPVTLTYYINTAYEMPAEVAAETAAATEVGFGSLLLDFGIAVLAAWFGYQLLKWLFDKIFAENKKLNGEYEVVGQKTEVVIDGKQTTVDITIDGEPANAQEQITEEKKAEPMSRATLIMFIISGVYLIGTWLMNTITGFLI